MQQQHNIPLLSCHLHSSPLPASMAASSSSAPAPEIQPAASSPNNVQITFQVFRKEPHYENFAYVNSKTLKLFPLQLLKKRFLKDNKVAYVAQINDKLVLQIRYPFILFIPLINTPLYYLLSLSIDIDFLIMYIWFLLIFLLALAMFIKYYFTTFHDLTCCYLLPP